LKFFFDNQLSPHLARSIHALASADGHEVTHLREKFSPATKDPIWIPALSKEGGWIIISGDLDIIRTRAERPVWKAAGLTGFFLKRGWLSIDPWEQAWRLVKWWPDIVKQARLATPGSTYGVQLNPNGKFETL
jgi:hypothetical protein